jgi:hypothetical protein
VIPGRIALAVACVAMLAAGVAVATAGRAAGPNLALVALSPKDVGGGARVVSQHAVRSPGFEAAFERELEFGSGVFGRSRLFYLTSTIELARAVATAQDELDSTRAMLATKKGRIAVVKAMEAELRKSLGDSLKAAAMGTIRHPKIGAGAIVVPIAVTTTGGRLQVIVTYLRVNRLLATMSIVGSRVAHADVERLLRVTADHARAQLGPVPLGPPSIAGVAAVGEVLTASSGSWSGGATSYGYRWSRCDTGGGACVAIPGATEPNYVPTAVDAGFTLRVTVTARNGAGRATALSPPTAVVVSAPGP